MDGIRVNGTSGSCTGKWNKLSEESFELYFGTTIMRDSNAKDGGNKVRDWLIYGAFWGLVAWLVVFNILDNYVKANTFITVRLFFFFLVVIFCVSFVGFVLYRIRARQVFRRSSSFLTDLIRGEAKYVPMARPGSSMLVELEERGLNLAHVSDLLMQTYSLDKYSGEYCGKWANGLKSHGMQRNVPISIMGSGDIEDAKKFARNYPVSTIYLTGKPLTEHLNIVVSSDGYFGWYEPVHKPSDTEYHPEFGAFSFKIPEGRHDKCVERCKEALSGVNTVLISSLGSKSFESPLVIRIEKTDLDEYIAKPREKGFKNLFGIGSDPMDAIESLKSEVESLYTDLMEDDNFSSDWLFVKEQFQIRLNTMH